MILNLRLSYRICFMLKFKKMSIFLNRMIKLVVILLLIKGNLEFLLIINKKRNLKGDLHLEN